MQDVNPKNKKPYNQLAPATAFPYHASQAFPIWRGLDPDQAPANTRSPYFTMRRLLWKNEMGWAGGGGGVT